MSLAAKLLGGRNDVAPPPRALDPRGSEIAGILQQLETMSPDQLSNLLTDADAFKQFMTRHLADTPAAKTLQDIAARNKALAQENLDAQQQIEEARNHVAVVKSSEFSSARSGFAELQARQQAVLDQLGSKALMQLLVRDIDKADAKSSELHDALLSGRLAPDAFVDQYLTQRVEYHTLDVRRQVAEVGVPAQFGR